VTRGLRKLSAAALVWRRDARGGLEVLAVHPGGPFFRGKDAGLWSLPKGEHETDDLSEAALLETALRELHEETGLWVETRAVPLGEVTQKAGKRVVAFGFEADSDLPPRHDPPQIRIEWPPGSGRELAFPEVDAARFLTWPEAEAWLNPAQVAFLDRLATCLGET
jgi:predicted NUDIX family NTP pyrophosphohydrolase